jgi:hypothetical protein
VTNTIFSPTDRLCRQKIDKETSLNNIIHQMDLTDNLTDIYRIFFPTVTKYTFFPRPQGTFFNFLHILGHKTNLKNARLK